MFNGYAEGQLAQAFTTAVTHEDPAVRASADRRVREWLEFGRAAATGRVEVGSRTPVADLPAWVTLKVLRGGFTTGEAAAAGPLEDDESAVAQRVGVPAERGAVFAHFVTDAGLAELNTLLDTGTYRVDLPEDAALLTMAWLVRAGNRAAALEILSAIAPFASTIRFAPRLGDGAKLPTDHVFRLTAGEARERLGSRREQTRVETEREALTVWNPFTDRVLALWWRRFADDTMRLDPSAAWLDDARALLQEYDELSARYTRCTKHRRPKENLAIMLACLQEVLTRGGLTPGRAALLERVVRSQIAKRGAPGSEQLARLREEQRRVAAVPSHRAVAPVAAARLAGDDPQIGLREPYATLGPVTASEAGAGLPAGTAMPDVVRRTLRLTHAAPVQTLVEEGVVPSAEVLAELAPAISGDVIANLYPDKALGGLMAGTYRAFRRRRSLLLLDLAQQVQLTELPWVRAVGNYRVSPEQEAVALARRMGTLYLDNFPGTIMPNPLVSELEQLFAAAGLELPLVPELAADIFMGQFSARFTMAAQNAATVVGQSLYTAYYAIDTNEIMELSTKPSPLRRVPDWVTGRPKTLGALCENRAGCDDVTFASVAANGIVIEQEQILTTHNLAALVLAGVAPSRGWEASAKEALGTMVRRMTVAQTQKWPLPTVKDAAYAWRQMVFFLSLLTREKQRQFVERALAKVAPTAPPAVGESLNGLREVINGAAFGTDGAVNGYRRLLGWSVGPHWAVLSDATY